MQPPIEIREALTRWLHREKLIPNIHMTLTFNGKYWGKNDNHKKAKLEALCDIVSRVAEHFPPMEVSIVGFREFGFHRDKLAAVLGYDKSLLDMRAELVRALKTAGIYTAVDFDYIPHIALGDLDSIKAHSLVVPEGADKPFVMDSIIVVPSSMTQAIRYLLRGETNGY
jgi:2'-5' RNA ligase